MIETKVYDESGRSLRPSSRHLLADASRSKWADPSGGGESPFATPLPLTSSSSLEVCKQQHSSDLHDALNDDDDDDREGSADLGSTWASRDFVPKRGVEIFVGGLTRSTRRDMLRDWFQHAGEVTEVRIARDKRRRRCRGYGYVRFSTSEQANGAIDTMHRFEFKHGRFLGVLPSDENRTLFVGGLREEWSCEYMCQLLKENMPGLRKVEPIPDREDRSKIRTFCFLEFASHAEAAVTFNRHHTTPRPPALPAQHTTTPSSPAPPGLASLELLLPSSACATGGGKSATVGGGGGGGNAGDGAEVFFERDTRDRSTSTCTTSCTSNGGGGCCRTGDCCGDESGLDSAATATTAPASASLDLRGSDALRFDGNGLGGVWGRQHLGIEDNHGGGGSGFCCWDEEPAASAAPAAAVKFDNISGEFDNNGGGSRGDAGDGEEAGTGTGGTVPLVVGGATLKVDWADPLRYHIHLNGGIKGPSASPEFGMPPDGQPCSRGGGDDGFPGGRLPQPGSGAPGNVRAVGCRFGVDSPWQQQRRGAHEQQAPVRQTSSLLSDPRWQDGDHHSARMAQGLQHERGQQQRCLDVSRDRRPSHLSHNGGVLQVPTLERGYTVAAGYTASRRSPFDADVDGVGGVGGRSVASKQHSRYGKRPRSKSSSCFHASLAAAAGTPEQQDYVDARIAMPSVHHRDHHRQARLRPHPTLAGGSVESQDPHPRMGATASGMVSVSGGGHGGMHESPAAQHHHHPLGAASGDIPTGRPYRAGPDTSAFRHGRREAFSASDNGDGDGDGDGTIPPSRSASCRPFSEQQHPAGTGGNRRAAARSPSWERHGLVEENTAGRRGYSSRGALDWPGSQREDLTAAVPHSRGQGQRQQHQRWEQPGVRDRATDASVMMKNRAPPPLDGVGGRDGSNKHRYTADFATFDRRFEQQQQQQQQQRPERFSNAASAAPQPHARRHTVSEGLGLSLGISDSQDNSHNPPPGFPASCAVDTFPPLLPHAGSGAAAAAEDGSAGLHLGAGLWESMGTGGLGCHERSSWPSVLLSPEATGRGDQPWGS